MPEHQKEEGKGLSDSHGENKGGLTVGKRDCLKSSSVTRRTRVLEQGMEPVRGSFCSI